ncbi:MAG: PIN domain-containing protein [Candidatus Altiarchaeota archaeon]|nr:PIN domain-containing protein [Candidatus Altiarchaeota archaeon]
MRYLDANVFIYAALYDGKKAEHAREILREMVEGDVAITSTLTIDEVVWIVWKESNREKAIKESVRILELPNLKVLSVDAKDAYSALNLMNKYQKLKPRDAIHLAVSLRAGVFRIISDDSDFDDVDEIEREKL